MMQYKEVGIKKEIKTYDLLTTTMNPYQGINEIIILIVNLISG